LSLRPGHDVKLHPHFHCHWQLFVLMCHEAGQSAFLHTQLYLSTNLRILIISYLATFLVTNSLYVLMCRKAVNQSVTFELEYDKNVVVVIVIIIIVIIILFLFTILSQFT